MAQQFTMEQFDNMVNNQFTKHDANADGKLDVNECRNLLQELHAKFSDKEWNEDVFQAQFKEADTDNDGHVDKAELHAHLLKKAQAKGLIA